MSGSKLDNRILMQDIVPYIIYVLVKVLKQPTLYIWKGASNRTWVYRVARSLIKSALSRHDSLQIVRLLLKDFNWTVGHD